jgi:hypothetical protein
VAVSSRDPAILDPSVIETAIERLWRDDVGFHRETYLVAFDNWWLRTPARRLALWQMVAHLEGC